MLAVKAAASARLGTVRVPPTPDDEGMTPPEPIPLMVLLPLLVPLAAAAAKDSVMLAKGHKFVVCTSPRSRWKHSKTAAPTELRRATMALTTLHLFSRVSYRSTELSEELPSLPPKAKRAPSTSTTSWVDLEKYPIIKKGNEVGLFMRTTYLRECIAAMGSQLFLRKLNRSPLDMHMVPSLPPMQYRCPSVEATPQLLLRADMLGTGCQRPTLGSNRSTLDW